MAEDEESARRKGQTSNRQTSDQRCEPVERGPAFVDPDDDRRAGVARVDRVRNGAAIGWDGDDGRLRRSARREAVATIVGP